MRGGVRAGHKWPCDLGPARSSKYVFLSAEENGVGVVSGASRTNPSVRSVRHLEWSGVQVQEVQDLLSLGPAIQTLYIITQ